MAKTIAGLYELYNKIGSGGGGIVFEGRHIRLDKKVVLKADRRKLSVGEEKLRREVDLLKELSHTYIPQVYDFVREDGIVYTVMDYIEGQSIDKILKRKIKIQQPIIIKWTRQLLEALEYLHTRPPHGILHGDIKPANIMLRPNGDICLIDYNIALALGENGAVKVGYSRGYASPEHYASEFGSTEGSYSFMESPAKGTEPSDSTTVKISDSPMGVSANISARGSGKQILLDARSDIYSLGATIYHIISGIKPPQMAEDVVPLSNIICSEAFGDIIKKAMAPNPEDRYQSAGEMLKAVNNIHKNDKRTKRLKAQSVALAFAACVLFICGVGLTLTGFKIYASRQEAISYTEQSNRALREGDTDKAIELAMKAVDDSGFLKPKSMPKAQKTLSDSLGVYNIKDGFKYQEKIVLPSVPYGIKLSPSGRFLAVGYAYSSVIYDTETMERLMEVPMEESAYADIAFLNDTRFVCAQKRGIACYDIMTSSKLWQGEPALSIAVSSDGSTVAATDRKSGYAHIYAADNGKLVNTIDFDGHTISSPYNDIYFNPGNYIFTLNGDGSKLAVSFDDGLIYLCDVSGEGDSYGIDTNITGGDIKGGFLGKYLAYTCTEGAGTSFAVVDTETASQIAGYSTMDDLDIRVSEREIMLATGGTLECIDIGSQTERELAFVSGETICAFGAAKDFYPIYTKQGTFSIYDEGRNRIFSDSLKNTINYIETAPGLAAIAGIDSPEVVLLRQAAFNEYNICTYDPSYIHDEARLITDGLGNPKGSLLFSVNGFAVFDTKGKMVCEYELPDKEEIYDQQFIRDNMANSSTLEVTWYDGTVRQYNCENGCLISEMSIKPPDKGLYMEYYTNDYRFEAALNNYQTVYKSENDVPYRTLEEGSHLTYVTELADYIITEYINSNGDRYGLLHNKKLDVLARLPGLCDIVGNDLIFDFKSGVLRSVPVYSLEELKKMGEDYLKAGSQ